MALVLAVDLDERKSQISMMDLILGYATTQRLRTAGQDVMDYSLLE